MATTSFTALGSPSTEISTDMNSLANDGKAVGAAHDNDGDATHGSFELVLASVDLSAQTNPRAELYLSKSIDGGTSYEHGDDAGETPPSSALAGVFPLDAINGAQRVVLDGIPLPNGFFKVIIINKAGAALAAADNSVRLAKYNYESA